MSLGPMEIILILAIVLIFFGPSRLPGLGKSVGEAIRGFKKGLNDDSNPSRNVSDTKDQISHSGSQDAQKQDQKEKDKTQS